MWATARMLTYKDLKPEQRGPWIFKLLGGKAWDACEHLSLDKLSSAEREAKIWKLLEPRFPEKEALGAIFALAAKDGEDLKSWTGRVRDTFDQCQRKGNVNFPPEAKGWILLHCAGMSEEQRAIVEAKSQGQLDLNWCHKLFGRGYKASTNRKRTIGVYQADEVPDVRGDHMDRGRQWLQGCGSVSVWVSGHSWWPWRPWYVHWGRRSWGLSGIVEWAATWNRKIETVQTVRSGIQGSEKLQSRNWRTEEKDSLKTV